jgi:hypothetical protein
MSQPHFGLSVRMKLTLPKVRTWSPLGLPKIQSSSSGVKTIRIWMFFIPLERSWSVDVQNGLAWAIWTSSAQVMVERRAESQIGSLTPDHEKSGIDSILMRAGELRHAVGKLSTRATTLVQTSSWSELGARSYGCPKSRNPNRDSFGTPPWESREKVPFGCSLRTELQRIL